MLLKRFERLFNITKLIHTAANELEIAETLIHTIKSEIIQADIVSIVVKQIDGTYMGYACSIPDFPISKQRLNIDTDAFVREIVTTKHSLYIENVTNDGIVDEERINYFNIKSILGIPMLIDDDVFAIIFLHDIGNHKAFSEDEISATEALVSMASVAIKNTKMMEQTQHLIKNQQLLLDIARSLSNSMSTRAVAQTCFDFIDKAIGIKDSGIFLYNEKERTLFPYALSVYSHITEEEMKEAYKDWTNMDLTESLIFHEVITEKKPVPIPDVFSDPRCRRENIKACSDFNIKGMLFLPLVANGSIFGVAILPSFDVHRKFSESEIELCQSICDTTAVALSNAFYAEQLESKVVERTLDLKKMNFTLEKAIQELKKVDTMKIEFIDSLSHELRTPLTSILASVELLEEGLMGSLTEKQQHIVKILSKAAERLLSRVDELLDFAKVENEKITLVPKRVFISDLINEAVRILEPLVNNKKQKIDIENSVTLPIYLDKERILQVLLNLLSNASKFTPVGGNIKVKSTIKNTRVVIEVIDTGIGIPSEKKEYIFNKFFQVNTGLTGTGLGLAISKQLIELHHGKMWFESEYGKGSVFAFELPIQKEVSKIG